MTHTPIEIYDTQSNYTGVITSVKKRGKNSHLFILQNDDETIRELNFFQLSKLTRFRDAENWDPTLLSNDPSFKPNLLGWKIYKSWDGKQCCGEVTEMYVIIENYEDCFFFLSINFPDPI
jgi:hypothetical protein